MGDHVRLTEQQLSIDEVTKLVRSNAAGAIATFTGTTRDTFKGNKVLYLEYEAYHDMALKEMSKLCAKARAKYDGLIGVAVFHRLGTVRVGEASVLIAVSSPHRAAALECCHFLIDELKATVPIWKKEHLEDGSVWKENPEFINRTSSDTSAL